MHLQDIKQALHPKLYQELEHRGITDLRPSQEKSIQAGLFDDKHLLVCTPTASGKTLVAEMACLQNIFNGIGKAIYIVPLKALAQEKYKEFKKRYGNHINIGLSIGNSDSPEPYLRKYDLIFLTSEKLDALLRHHTPWLKDVKTIVVDEIHLLNDNTRGPTLEILITLLKQILKQVQIIGLSATIGNAKELASWLKAELVVDSWRPTKLYKGIYMDNSIDFYE